VFQLNVTLYTITFAYQFTTDYNVAHTPLFQFCHVNVTYMTTW